MRSTLVMRPCVLALLLLTAKASASDNGIPSDVFDAMIERKDWAGAEQLIERTRAFLTQRDRLSYPSAVHGPLLFKSGYCELKQQKWEEAMSSFEACYKKFPPRENDHNPYHVESLRYWAEAAAGAKDFERAVRLYRKYIAEEPRLGRPSN